MRHLKFLIVIFASLMATSRVTPMPLSAEQTPQVRVNGSPYTYFPLISKSLPIANVTSMTASPSSPVSVTTNHSHQISVNGTVDTTINGAFTVTLYEGSTYRDSECHLIGSYGTWTKSFTLDVLENGVTWGKEYTLEARFKLGVSDCQASSAFPDATATAPYHIDWQPEPCNPPHGTQLLRNGSFEEGWSDVNESIQQANFWNISWVPNGQLLYDESDNRAWAAPEFTHKLAGQLPPWEQICQPGALILDGTTVYKIFHGGLSFGGEMKQTVSGLTPGMSVKLTVPILLIPNQDTDPYGSASGVWINGAGGWVWATTMGSRRWYYHQPTITVPGSGQVEILIRVKSRWQGVDFFVDDVRLEPN